MLPLKLYPTFIARPEFCKLDLTLKVSCRLPANLRIKELVVKFRVLECVSILIQAETGEMKKKKINKLLLRSVYS